MRRTLIKFIFVLIFVIGSGLTNPSQCWGQSEPTFEVASVKRVDNSKLGDAISMNIGTIRGEQITFGNATLNDCIRFAYGISSDTQIAGPSWIKSKEYLYDVVGRGAPGASPEQLKAMMRVLLAERFRLVTHREQKEMSYNALVLAKNGPKIQPRKEIPQTFQATTWGGRINSILTMPSLAYLLSRFEAGRPIIDQTGLSGMYEVRLNWTLSQHVADSTNATEPSLPTALSEQLGLRLESRKRPLEVLIVDGADKAPEEN